MGGGASTKKATVLPHSAQPSKRRSQHEVLSSATAALGSALRTLPPHLKGRALIDVSEAAGLDMQGELRAWALEREVRSASRLGRLVGQLRSGAHRLLRRVGSQRRPSTWPHLVLLLATVALNPLFRRHLCPLGLR